MSYWQQYNFHQIIRQILGSAVYTPNAQHHFGRPFMSPYQIAIELNHQHPHIAQAMGYQIGGVGTNQQYSLAQYIAGQLSTRIGHGEITDIEGAFFSNIKLEDIYFDNYGSQIQSSVTDSENDMSMYRLRDNAMHNEG